MNCKALQKTPSKTKVFQIYFLTKQYENDYFVISVATLQASLCELLQEENPTIRTKLAQTKIINFISNSLVKNN
ncbi:MAG: hypothetical protein K940chlam8_00943 [Chlamydiae bacterium]|nr:hypothetical protein [Chlamydiota bacterium]